MEENQGSPQGFYAQPLLGCEVELYPSWIPMVGLIVESMLLDIMGRCTQPHAPSVSPSRSPTPFPLPLSSPLSPFPSPDSHPLLSE